MNISQLKNNYNQNKIIFLTTNNSTPIKMKRFSFSNSKTSNQLKPKCRNKNKIKEAIINNNSSSYNILNESQKYIFNNYKISPLIALLIYEKSINKLFDFIKRRMPKNNFIEIKKKYISFIVEELHIKSKNILLDISEQDLMNLNVKLFTSNINITNNANNYFAQSNKLNLNSNLLYKCNCNCNSNSLFKLNKDKSKKNKLLSFNSFNNAESKNQNKSSVNSSNILLQPKKSKNICHTEYVNKNNGLQNKFKKKKKIEVGAEFFNHLRNISMTNGSPNNIPTKNLYFENRKKVNLKEKIINKEKKIGFIKIKKNNNLPRNIIEENKKYEEKIENVNENNYNKNINEIKEAKVEEKNCLHQLNLIKENLEDNLKNMFNFSYGYYLNYDRESDSSKSLYKLNNDYSNIKIN